MSNRCQEVSYHVSQRVAKLGKPHTIAEVRIIPAAEDICQVTFEENFAQQISDIALSNNNVSRCISDMASDVEEQLLANIMQSQYYVLQLDETTDVVGLRARLPISDI